MISDYANGFEERQVSARDGLLLSARDYRPQPAIDAGRLPVVCLPGLSRNARDFHQLALLLSRHPTEPRRVVALDYRGRGRSAWDPDKTHYSLPVESDDVLSVVTALGIEHGVFIGTSRGGLILHLLSALRPAMIRATVLNDIGPAIENAGLAHIKAYLSRGERPRSFEDAARILQDMHGRAFPRLAEQDWRDMAHAVYAEKNGKLVADFDPAITEQLKAIDLAQPLPTLWEQFTGLTAMPMLAIRGEHSLLLSQQTFLEMARRHPRLTAVTAPGQGHTPVLHHTDVFGALLHFLRSL
ncbi:alpha/beta hydrolase [Rhizobium sp. TRM95111]|uniref:alpha/beta fold hydrolase n=1 Tax=Rhizobium alarense TaxID=2846851 RepID=UPI001F3E69EC|nr:alpha/beta hydrolase [Rhizobium alarense]MCF3641660.1 alpha/beta hydrolase [Rhizobium alarense]